MKASAIVFVTASASAIALGVLACTGDDAVVTPSTTPEGGASSGTSGTSGSSGSSGASGASGSSGTSGSSGASGTSGSSGAFDAAGAMVVFATSGEFTADFGGVAGADMYCQTAARNANLPNAMADGSYLAWIATVASDAPAMRFKQSSTGYKLVDDTVLAVSWADLVDGKLLAPITMTESKGALGATTLTWTNVKANGTLSSGAKSCGAWTTLTDAVTYGNGTATGEAWTDSTNIAPATQPCSKALRIYCFQQP